MNTELDPAEHTAPRPTTPPAKDVASWLWMVNNGTILVKRFAVVRINAHFSSKEAAEIYVANATK